MGDRMIRTLKFPVERPLVLYIYRHLHLSPSHKDAALLFVLIYVWLVQLIASM